MPVLLGSDQLGHAARVLRAIPDGVARAAASAMNRASLAAKTAGIRRLMATYTTKRDQISRTVVTTRASKSDLTAGFSSSGGRIPLTSFQMSPRGPTVRGQRLTFSVRRGSGGKTIGHGFANVTKGGRLMALQRVGSARYPVRALFGPAAPQMLGEEGVREEIETRAKTILDKRFDHEVGRLLQGAMK